MEENHICRHEHIGKEIIEFDNGKSWINTGDYICYDCKETFSEKPNKK